MATNKKIKLSFEIDGVKESAKNIGDLEKNLKLLNDEIKDAEIGGDKFKELSSAIAQTSSEIKGLELSMEGLDAEGKASAFGSFAAGMAETATGAVALSGALGVTNESSNEMVETLVSGMAVAQSFRGGLEGIISAQKLMKASTIGTTAATTGSSVAMRILNAVMNMNPIFLLITALVTFIALLAIFGSGTNDAAAEAESLNDTLNDQADEYDNLTAAIERNLTQKNLEIDQNTKLVESELKVLNSKKKLTEEEKKRKEELEKEVDLSALKKIDNQIAASQEKLKELPKQIGTQFKEVDSIIKATDYEDGINDINYNSLRNKNKVLQNEMKVLLSKGFTKENVDEQVAAIAKLQKKSQDFTQKLKTSSRKLGDAEKEVFEDSIESSKNMNSLLGDLVTNANAYKNSLADKDITTQLQEDEKTLENIAEEEKKAADAQQRQNEYAKIQKGLKDDILKIDQALALAAIDTSDFDGQEAAAVLKREQSLQNELAGIEGNSARALELRAKNEELAGIEIEVIRAEFAARRKAKDTADGLASETSQLEAIAKAIQGEEMLAQAKLDAKLRATEGEEGGGFEAERLIEQERYAAQLTDLTTALDNELLTEQQYNEMLELAEEEHGAKMVDIQTRTADAEEELQEKKKEMALQATMGLLGGINDLVQAFAGKSDAAQKKAFKVNKAFQIAQATIDTIKGGVSAFTGMVSQIPGPVGIVLGAVAAAGVVASGIASIKKIASTKFQGTGGGGAAPNIPKPGGGSGGSAAPVPPSINLFGQPNEGSEGGNEQALGARQQPTVKAVVVESDITNVQNRLNTYQQRSEIG
jgi:hypothetical protein